MNTRAARIFRHLDTLREGVFQFLDVRNDEDFLEIVLDGVQDFDEPLPALAVLRAEAFVENQRLQLRAGAPRQQPRKGDTHREVDTERLAAAEEFVGPGSRVIRDLDVQRLDLMY